MSTLYQPGHNADDSRAHHDDAMTYLQAARDQAAAMRELTTEVDALRRQLS